MGTSSRRAVLLGLAGLLLAPPALPATDRTPLPAASECRPGVQAPDWPAQKGVLFQVTAPNGQASRLFGTLHFGSLAELGLSAAALRQTLGEARILVNEVDGAAPADPALDRQRLLDDGLSLPSLIGARAFVELARRLPGIAPAQLQTLRPWLALALLESRGEPVSAETLDHRIEQLAREQGLATQPLETAADQLAALNCVSSWDQAVVLRQRLRQPDFFAEQAARVLDWYRARDLPAWLAEVDAMRGLDAQGAEIEQRARVCLLESRNQRWMARLEPALQAGGAFVAVGGLHLAGDEGLLARLCRRGYLITAEPY